MSLPVAFALVAPPSSEPAPTADTPPERPGFAARLDAAIGAERPPSGAAAGDTGRKPRRRRRPDLEPKPVPGLETGGPVLPFPGLPERAPLPLLARPPAAAPSPAVPAGATRPSAVGTPVVPAPLAPPVGSIPLSLASSPAPVSAGGAGRGTPARPLAPMVEGSPAPRPAEAASTPAPPPGPSVILPSAAPSPEPPPPLAGAPGSSPPAAGSAAPRAPAERSAGPRLVEAPLEALLPAEPPAEGTPLPSAPPAAWRVEPPPPPPARAPGVRARRNAEEPAGTPRPVGEAGESAETDPAPGLEAGGTAIAAENPDAEVPFLGLVGGPAPHAAPELDAAPVAAPLPEPPPDAGVPALAPPVPERIEVRVDDPRGAWELAVHRDGDRLALVVRAGAEVREVVRQGEGELRERLAAEGTPLGELLLQHHGSQSNPERYGEGVEAVVAANPGPRRRGVASVSAAAPQRGGRLLDRDA